MFTKEELLANWRNYRDWTMPPLEVSDYGHRDFVSLSTQELIVVARGLKAHVSDALRFWFGIRDVMELDDPEPWLSRWIEAALCTPVSETEYRALVSGYSRALELPLPAYIHELSHWVAGLLLYREWDHVVVIVETLEAFIYFEWRTTC